MLEDSFSAATRVVLTKTGTSAAAAAFDVTCSLESAVPKGRVEMLRRRGLADFAGIGFGSPMSTLVGITEASSAVVMPTPNQPCSGEGVFESSPISVLQGLGDDAFTPSPVPTRMSTLNSNHRELLKYDEVGVSRASQLDDVDDEKPFRLPLLKMKSIRKSGFAEESFGVSWNGSHRKSEICRSGSDIIRFEKEQEGGEAEGHLLSQEIGVTTVGDIEEPESPTTPNSVPWSLDQECPDAPSGSRSRELNRQGSLNDTKLLMTTRLKRSASIFMFDKHFEFLREIGRGSLSTVYEARDRRSGLHCAVKMSRRQFRGRDDREHYLREIQSVACLSEHANVVKYYRSWQQASHFYIQMELCESGSLRNLLDSSAQYVPETQVWNFIHQVAAGLAHIHAQGILHLDIKPENIFVDVEGVLKIGDFGLAVPCRLWEWEEGDGGYVAPELLREEEPGPAADMYSFGVMVYEWATRTKLPRSGPLREGQIELPESRSKTLEDLVRQLLNPIPSRRPTAAEVISWRRMD